MSRTFLPALRGITAGGAPPAVVESKALQIGGYHSTIVFGDGRFNGDEPGARAAGWDVTRAVVEGYERVVWVYRCVELMSGDTSRLPFRIGRNLGTDKQEVLEDHPLYRVLNKRANPLETGRAFRKRLAAQVLLSKKGAFIEVTKNRLGEIVRLDLLDPDRVEIIPSANGEYIKHFQYTRRDGAVLELPPSKVRWVREPHPTDPFSGTTPLEAAGMSVELDFLSRVYNVSFIKNDSRPGGVLGVDADGLSDEQLERLERKFEPGAHAAGKITVLGTGPGGLSYLDTTTKPRDMAYHEAAQNAKNEVLAAFGIGESVLGNAAGRTFDNAEQELYNYWTGPMSPFMELLASAFDDDIDDEWDGFLDTSSVAALELPRRRAREEARAEVREGLRSIDEYRPLAGLPTINSPQSRALWVSPAKAPLPVNENDARALGMEVPEDGQGGQGGAEGQVQEGTGDEAAQAVQEAMGGQGSGPAEGAVAAARDAESVVDGTVEAEGAVAAARESTPDEFEVPHEAAGAVAAALERKALDPMVAEAPEDDEYAQVTMAVAALLEAQYARHLGIINARIQAPKTRKGTKFWTPTPGDTRGGDAPLDTEKIVPGERLTNETVETAQPVVENAAATAGAGLLAALGAAGMFGAAGYTAQEYTAAAGLVTQEVVEAALRIIAAATTELLEGSHEVINQAQATATTIDQVTDAVTGYYTEKASKVAHDVAEAVAFSTINGAREAAAESVVPVPGSNVVIQRAWVTRGDDRVRPAHRAVDGQVEPVGVPFDMPGGSVLFPRDPAGPPHLTFGCRCRLRYFVTEGVGLIPVA